MKGKQKKNSQTSNGTKESEQVQESSDDESYSGSEESENTDVDDNVTSENINVEFEAQGLVEADFHGVRQLILRVFLTLHADVSELTNLIISQSAVGSTIKIVDDEEDEIYGVVSILSMTKYQEKACMQELMKELLSKCKTSSNNNSHEKLEKLFKEKNIGFLVNERFINIPGQIAAPFHNSLKEEVDSAKIEDKSFDFDYLLLISKTLRPDKSDSTDGQSSSQPPKKKKKKNMTKTDTSEIEYTNFEDETFYKNAEMSFSYDVTKATGLAVGGGWDFQDEKMRSYRTVMIVPTSKWKVILQDVEDMVK